MVTEQNVFHPILFYHFKIVNGQVLFFFFFLYFFSEISSFEVESIDTIGYGFQG